MSKVYLVGAGPGDPELITCKGRRVLESADSVLYDNLACRALLNLAPRQAERIYVGKKKTEHAYSQDEICRMLIDRAREGKNVVRLKGGDPFIFGRGGEEAEALADAGIDFEVVPGVTTPLGIAAYCGVPLTHREHTSVVTFITGHDVNALDWRKIAASETLVVFMGLTGFSDIARALMENGKPPETPAMVVRWATRPDQVTVVGTLADLSARIKQEGVKPPATIIVGPVVELRDKLNWFERLPLFGTRIIVTRAADQAGALSGMLRALAADVVEFPTIEIRPMDDYELLDAAIDRLPAYDWLIFTSANGVRYFFDRLDRSKRDLRSLKARICAIGPATRQAIESHHLKVDLVPEEYVAESLVKAFDPFDVRDQRLLLPRAAAARELLPDDLRRRGACVDVVPAYRTVIPDDAAERVREVFARKTDWVLFTSSSTVKNFVSITGAGMPDGVRVASIGPVTSETARNLGVQVAVEAQPYTVDGLVAAVVANVTQSIGTRKGQMAIS